MVVCELTLSWINIHGTESTETFDLTDDDNAVVISNESPFMIDIRKYGPLIINEFAFHYAFDGTFDQEIQNVPQQTQECKERISTKINESLDKIEKSIVFPNKTVSVAPSFKFSFAGEETQLLYTPVNENNIYDRIKQVLNIRYVEKLVDSDVFLTYMNPKEEQNRCLGIEKSPFVLLYFGCAIEENKVIAAGWRFGKKILNSANTYAVYYDINKDAIEYFVKSKPRYIIKPIFDHIVEHVGFVFLAGHIEGMPTVSLPNPETDSKCLIQ